jgi:hypothetical protein
MHFHIDEDGGLVVAQASGALTDQEIIDAIDAIVTETNGAALFKPVLFLFDERTSLHNLNVKGLSRIRESMECWVRRYPGRKVRTAFVASHNMHAAYAKLWQAITEANPAIGTTVELFASEEAALAWLEA